MIRKIMVSLFLIVLTLLPVSSRADVIVRTMYGANGCGSFVALEVTIEFTPTGGDFVAGTGTATASFTLENISGLQPFQDPAIGNPIATGFMFNVPPDAVITGRDSWVLAGSSVYSTGVKMSGKMYPPGCSTLGADELYNNWYELQDMGVAGSYGIFTNSIETNNGVKGGILDPEVLINCELQGDVFSPLFIVGHVKHVITLESLGTELDTAEDFLSLCSIVPGEQVSSAFVAKFQGADEGGELSCRVHDVGYCGPIDNEEKSWGSIKNMYRE